MTRYDTFSDAVEAFLSSSEHLTDADAPMVTALTIIARALDNNPESTRLLHEYGVTFRHLQKSRGDNSNEGNEAEDFLNGL